MTPAPALLAVPPADDLTGHWSALLGRRERAPALRARLWLLLLDGAGRPLPVLPPVDDVPEDADPAAAARLMALAAGSPVQHPGRRCSAAVVLARPGPAAPTAADAGWRRALQAAADGCGVHLAAVHVAACGRVQPVPERR